MKEYSKHWKSSKQPGKQRKYLAKAPLHTKRKMLSALLSKKLRKDHGRKNIPLRKGDRVKVMRGKYKRKEGKITNVHIKTLKVTIEGIQRKKLEGSKVDIVFQPSNLQIVELNTKDKKRLKRTAKPDKETQAEEKIQPSENKKTLVKKETPAKKEK